MASSTVVINDLTQADVEAVARLFHADMKDLGEDASLEDLVKVVEALIEDDGRDNFVRVARFDDGRIVGVILANYFLSIKFPGKSLWIEELYVHPDARRRGIGVQLVEHLMEWANRNGFRGIELEAYRMNTAASILYRSLGFRRLARERYSFSLADYELDDE